MNRFFFLLLLCLVPLASVCRDFNGGILAGLTATQVDGDGHGGYDKLGIVAGIWVGRSINDNLSVMGELRYIQKGSYSREVSNGILYGFYRMQLHYSEIPVYVRYQFRPRTYASAGLSMGYLWKAREENELGSLPEERIAMFRKLEPAARVGIEYGFTPRWSAVAFFSYSLYPIRPHTGDITYRFNFGQTNSVIELYARYSF